MPTESVSTGEVADAFWQNRLAQPDALATGVTVRWQAIVIRFLPDAEAMVRRYFKYIDAHRQRSGPTWPAG